MRTDKRIDALTFSPRFLRLGSALLLTIVAASSHADSNAVRDADDSRISVASVAGEVDFTMAGNAVEASPNDTVLLPARIVTGHDGNVGLTQAGTNVSVANDSDVEIPAEAVDGNLIARMVQHRGNVFYDVAPRDLGKHRVETPFLVAVIKGTQFNVAVDERGTTISLFEGSLEIHTPDDSDIIQLNAGEIAIRPLLRRRQTSQLRRPPQTSQPPRSPRRLPKRLRLLTTPRLCERARTMQSRSKRPNRVSRNTREYARASISRLPGRASP